MYSTFYSIILTFAVAFVVCERPPLICRDPDAGTYCSISSLSRSPNFALNVGGTTQNRNRKFVLVGNANSEGAGE